MTIQWFPGHMAKARREVTEKLKLVDIVMELVDARLPLSSRNPMMDEIVQHKPRLVLLNKADLADPRITDQWVKYFRAKGLDALPINAIKGEGLPKAAAEAKRLFAPKIEAMAKKGIRPRATRAMILGIPNVGKSSLINRMAKKTIAKTGDRPGVTQAQQWIKVGKDFELLDTPGILWPKFEDQQVGLRLAATGAIKEEILDTEPVAIFIVKLMNELYKGVLESRYNLESLPEDPREAIEAIGRKRGFLRQGNVVDLEATWKLLIREFRGGQFGRISLENPNELKEQVEEQVQPEQKQVQEEATPEETTVE
ncbi:ribosome biogenesis GTPase YlqF [Tumebacillus sp. ITR2]|uniref:Ribosome biogenesis GTPase A n=1 Tax=Tumebacillus amylolyticus TaxID=2801339 RepID=A0ABS1JF18_9BACL|nr:ribosome biogenesis GTPase YlqF [Tumebacillus amylolyticus]MBL0388876.1 ribosome biogenesis GTPase YlqF [Tumebacillus amylolyticus]